ncbi:MAG: MFS transporter [Lentisphaeria bacterium]|nr:MFS transporter [Lentisphaeria bacterium]
MNSPSAPANNRYWIVNLICLWFSQIAVMAGFSALIPFIPLYITEELGITDKGQIASAVSLFNFFGSLAYAVFCPIWGKLSDRFGVKPMLLRGTFLTCLIFPAMGYCMQITRLLSPVLPWISAVGMLIFLRFLSAACAGTTAASQVMIARTVPDDKQGFALGSLTTSFWGGAMMGNVVGGLIIDKFGYLASFWACGMLYLIAGIFILFTRDNPVKFIPPPIHIKQDNLSGILPRFTRAVWVMMFLFLLMGTVRSLEVPYVALKIQELSSKEQAAYWTGIISAFVCCAAVLSGVISGWLSDRCPPGKLLLPSLACSALALIWQGAAKDLVSFTIARSLLYITAGGFHPILLKVLSSITPTRKRGSVFGFSSCMNSSGVMLAALLGGYIYICTSVSGIFIVAAITQIACLPILFHALKFAVARPRFKRKRRMAKWNHWTK